MIDELTKWRCLNEAHTCFSDEERCLALLVSLRWPDGIACMRCGSSRISRRTGRAVWLCNDCRKEFSIRVGTFMEDSPVELRKWLTAFWLITSGDNQLSSHDIHRLIGVTQKTAWFMLHRIRLACGYAQNRTGIEGRSSERFQLRRGQTKAERETRKQVRITAVGGV